MVDSTALLADAKRLASSLVDDLRWRSEEDEASQVAVRGIYGRALEEGRTDKAYEEWLEDLLAQVTAGWVLAGVFVRFCEDNCLVDTPLLSGPGKRLDLARDHRAEFFAHHPTAGDREWLKHVFRRYQQIPAVAEIFGKRNPLWLLAPSADGARAILELWWLRDNAGRTIRHNFHDDNLDTGFLESMYNEPAIVPPTHAEATKASPASRTQGAVAISTRFLGDLYQDLSEHARKEFALLQTPDFVESFILNRTLEPAIDTFGLGEVRMIDPACGSGHFLIGAFHRLFAHWQKRSPGIDARESAQRALDAVHGVDINPFAVDIARFRLLVASLQAAGIVALKDLPAFRLNLVVGDSLLHGAREGGLFSGAWGLPAAVKHHYETEDAAELNRILQIDRYHVVVGNPPYITVKDSAMNRAYRGLYDSCYRQYSLVVPFMQRFFQLAVRGNTSKQAGFVGMISANSFMKREFGSRVIEQFLPTVDLTHVIDTSGAYIPGHGTPTVIVLGRDRKPLRDTVRAVLGIRGEPGRPEEPANGLVWSSISGLVDKPGAENDFVSVDDVDRQRFLSHPWSLQGGAAPPVLQMIESTRRLLLEECVDVIGFGGITGEDNVYVLDRIQTAKRLRLESVRPLVIGEDLRDWLQPDSAPAMWPYDELSNLLSPSRVAKMLKFMWPYRRSLQRRKRFGVPVEELKLPWYEWRELYKARLRTPLSIVFAFVATHNHFVLDRGGKVFKQSAPVIKLAEGAGEDEHLELLGLLNSSTACFWMKQVFHNKGSTVDTAGARQTTVPFEDFWEFDSTKLKQFPLPEGRPLRLARALDDTARQLAEVLPAAVAAREVPSREALDAAREKATVRRRWMVALQEELDWRCYRLYGLVDEDLTYDIGQLPALERGERAFEIALARRMAAREVTTTWFERHGSTPITELPEDWPDDFRALVERRLAVIDRDRGIRLLERPEYKRRWNWDDLADLERQAQRVWLLDRIEALLEADAGEPAVTTCARLADRLAADQDAVAVAQDLAGMSVDLVALVTELVESAGVPYLAAWRLKDPGMRIRAAWERTWELQRKEDELDARAALPEDHPDHLSTEDLERERKAAGVDRIPVPPKYKSSDFRSPVTWRLRGKLDVPKERFILYPATRTGADTTLVVGWAGWDHLAQATALAAHLTARKTDGAESDELVPLLAGVAELVPWLLQWHDDPDPVYGERMGQFFAGFVATEAAALGVTADDLRAWRPQPTARGRHRTTRARP